MENGSHKLASWFGAGPQPFVVAGPCSAENEAQVLATAHAVAALPGVRVFRSGLWKPRTRPGGFQGVGREGLSWLARVRQETGLLTATEVAGPEHIELALKAGVDMVWIGARTVVNPFSVQEIADALRGCDVAVMVKNPVHPEVKLWTGAIERLQQAGLSRLIAVHRGFHYFQGQPYRNTPMWEIPIEMMRLNPGIPMLCDPSHIAGRRDAIQSISQKALDLEMAGLMIETHIDPAAALTDARQQLRPEALRQLLSELVVRRSEGAFPTRLEELRSEIDKIDWELLDILSKRMKIINEIGEYKKEHDVTILQIRRWRDIIIDRLAVGTRLGLERDFLLKLLELVHQESIRRQMDILNWPPRPESGSVD